MDIDFFYLSPGSFCTTNGTIFKVSFVSSNNRSTTVGMNIPIIGSSVNGTEVDFSYTSNSVPGVSTVGISRSNAIIYVRFLSNTTANATYSVSLFCGTIPSSYETDNTVDDVPAPDPAPPVVQFGNSFYRLSTTRANFLTALSLAAGDSYLGLPGHLATVTTAEENAFVASYIANWTGNLGVWLAGTNSLSPGAYDLMQWAAGPELRMQLLFRVSHG